MHQDDSAKAQQLAIRMLIRAKSIGYGTAFVPPVTITGGSPRTFIQYNAVDGTGVTTTSL